MEIKLPLAGFSQPKGTHDPISDIQRLLFSDKTALYPKNQDALPEKATPRELVKKTADLLSSFDRNLKFELVEDAGVIQLQVIDASDGRIVRKVPSDEVLKLVSHMRETLSEHLDVTV